MITKEEISEWSSKIIFRNGEGTKLELEAGHFWLLAALSGSARSTRDIAFTRRLAKKPKLLPPFQKLFSRTTLLAEAVVAEMEEQ